MKVKKHVKNGYFRAEYAARLLVGRVWLRPALKKLRPRIDAEIDRELRKEYQRLQKRLLDHGFDHDEVNKLLAHD